MADNSVFITGAAEGAFGDALATLPQWATEKTALKISGLLQQQVKALNAVLRASGTGASSKSASTAEVESELAKLSKSLIAQNKEAAKKLKQAKEQEEADKKSLIGGKQFANKWQKAAFVLDGLAVVGKKVLDTEKQYIKTYDAMFTSGVNVLAGQNSTADGFQALNHVVTLTKVRLEVLQEVAQKYAASINAFGFNKFAKSLSSSTKQLESLGFSSRESAELLGAYTETAQGYNDIRGLSEKEMSNDVIKFGAAITKLSLATGMSRDQMLNNTKAIAKSVDASLLFSKYGKESAGKMIAFASSFADQSLGKELVSMATQNINALNSTFTSLNSVGLGPFAMHLQNIMKNKGATGEAHEVTNKKIEALVGTITAAEKNNMKIMAEAGNPLAAQAQEFINNLSQYDRGQSKQTPAEIEAAIATKAAAARLQTQIEATAASAQAAFAPTIDQINILTKSMTLLNGAIYGVIENTKSEARSWAAVGLMAAGSLATGLAMVAQVKTIMNLTRAATTAASVASAAGTAAAGTAAAGTAAAGTAAAGAGTMVAGAAVAGLAGWAAGKLIVEPLIEAAIEKVSGVKGRTIGSAIYDQLNPDSAFDGRPTQLSVPKAPAQSTIQSPAAVPVPPVTNALEATPTASTTSTASPGANKQGSNEINNILIAQTNLLEQIRLASVKSVEVSEDILRYTRSR